MKRISLAVLGLAILVSGLFSDALLPQNSGAATPRVHALRDARVVVSPEKSLSRATIVLRDGVIVALGPDLDIPPDARIWEAESLTVYPGLIEPYLRLNRLKGVEPREVEWRGPAHEPAAPGTGNTHPRVRPERTISDEMAVSEQWWTDYHRLGFTAAYVVPDSGVFRGRGALLNLRGGRAAELELSGAQIQCLAYDRGSKADGYPRSLMGVVSLMRQTFIDAQWYRQAMAIYEANPVGVERPERDRSLAALAAVIAGEEPVLVETNDALAALRAGRMAREFHLDLILRGSGEEYRQISDIAALQAPIILPVAFPATPEMKSEGDHWDLSLEALRAWDQAPSNPARLDSAGVVFALSSDGLDDPSRFWPSLRAAMSRGLPPEALLRALTLEPARLLGVDDRLGSIEVGKIANLAVTDGDLFARETRVRMVFVDGNPMALPEDEDERDDARGLWRIERIAADARSGDESSEPRMPVLSWLRLGGKKKSPTARWSAGELRRDPSTVESVACSHDTILVAWLDPGAAHADLPARLLLRAGFQDEKRGWLVTAAGDSAAIRAFRRQGPPIRQEEKLPEAPTPPAVVPGPCRTPDELLVRGATVWTCAADGIPSDADLLVAGGKVRAVGRDLDPPDGALVIAAEGLHLTPGIMDCHSHMAIVGDANEGSRASSAMVRIEDVINSDSPHIYRQLAGGVTLANLLHGSANPIGGQSAVMKLRWGAGPDALHVKDAEPGLKCALGENVTQKSWGGADWKRYPKTRMGVEQFFRDRFFAARDYGAELKRYESLGGKERGRSIPPRRDLELDCLLEVLGGERFIHCHAYRADEMIMIIRVAEDFGFQIRTFDHVLEGYKIADEMAAHGVAGTAFSDWWAYKPEVYDAIPYNGALLHQRGVNVTYNSDSAELARRLNLEAAKAVKYGGVPEEEALKFVTLNTAVQLGLAHRVGSLEPGKDADFVIWSGHPLDSGSICLQTWIEGAQYFDRDEDRRMRRRLHQERDELIAKARRSYVEPAWKKRGHREDKEGGYPEPDEGSYSCWDEIEEGGAR